MIAILVATATLCLVCIGVHFEALRLISSLTTRIERASRLKVALAVLLALLAHLIEVGLFAVGWAVLLEFDLATLSREPLGAADIVYFSLTAYTSLGFGDIVPIGACGVLAGVQALVGLVLIAWTASFTMVEMRRYWVL